MLDRDLLQVIDKYCYDRWDIYHSAAYNRQGLMTWESQVIERYFTGCKRLLIAGAGGGREVLALSKLGYEVDGFECHPELVMLARKLVQEEGLPCKLDRVLRDEAPSNERKYDGLIVGWGAYMLIQGSAKRIAFLRQLRDKVAIGSPLLVSFYARQHSVRYLRVTAASANWLRWLLRRDSVEIGDSLAPNYVHFFTKAEIRAELQRAGFDLVFYETKEYGHAVAVASNGDRSTTHDVERARQYV